jgi:oligopeptide/dipeptide ABC transporter ATP-binding protein
MLELLRDMKREFDLSLLLITHDLGVIAETADRVAVMYAGRIVEQGPVRQIFRNPQHPYTRGLLASIPGGAVGSRLKAIEGTVPNLAHLPKGCAFEPRCGERIGVCADVVPAEFMLDVGHSARCHLHAAPGSRLSASAAERPLRRDLAEARKASEGGPDPDKVSK